MKARYAARTCTDCWPFGAHSLSKWTGSSSVLAPYTDGGSDAPAVPDIRRPRHKTSKTQDVQDARHSLRKRPRRNHMSLAELDRRDVLRGAGALTLSLQFAAFTGRAAGQPAAPTALTAWVRITPDDRVTLILSQAEIGQGISTTLPAILADELGADWSRIVVENAPVAQKDISPYQNPRIHFMFTGNSESIASFSTLMRQTGAAAREMLIAAAVTRWRGAKAADCTTASG